MPRQRSSEAPSAPAKFTEPKCLVCELFPWIIAMGLCTGFAASWAARSEKYPMTKAFIIGSAVFGSGAYYIFPNTKRIISNRFSGRK